MGNALILCFDNGTDECWNCGGWRGAEGGPFAGDERFCSFDCASEHQEHHPPGSDYCASCGYDQHEHADNCLDGAA